MIADEIFVIDSSDDENKDQNCVPKPAKKFKLENDLKHEQTDVCTELKITQVTSLNEDSDIIEINSGNETDNNSIKLGTDTDSTIGDNDINQINDLNSGTEGCSTSNDVKKSSDELIAENVTNVQKNGAVFNDLVTFIESCIEGAPIGKYRDVIVSKADIMKTKYDEAEPDYVQSKSFKKLLETNLEQVQKNPINAIMCFKNIFEELKSRKVKTNIELSDKQEIYVAKLRKTLKQLDKAIRRLENQEVDWEDDNDSSYIQLDRYKKKFVDVWKKYCEYVKDDPYSCRITHRKLDFNASKYVDVNRAIDRLYFKDKKFPVFYAVDKCIRKCVKDKGIEVAEYELVNEIKHVYKQMGELVQRRRKTELEDIHTYFLGTNIDPATEDSQLLSTLEQQKKEGDQKIDKVFETFQHRQEQGEEPPISSDSDDSGEIEKDTSDDEKEKENGSSAIVCD